MSLDGGFNNDRSPKASQIIRQTERGGTLYCSYLNSSAVLFSVFHSAKCSVIATMNKCSITVGLIAALNVIAVTTASKKRVIHTMVIEILQHFFFFYTPSGGPIYAGTVSLEQHAQSCVMDLMKIF